MFACCRISVALFSKGNFLWNRTAADQKISTVLNVKCIIQLELHMEPREQNALEAPAINFMPELARYF